MNTYIQWTNGQMDQRDKGGRWARGFGTNGPKDFGTSGPGDKWARGLWGQWAHITLKSSHNRQLTTMIESVSLIWYVGLVGVRRTMVAIQNSPIDRRCGGQQENVHSVYAHFVRVMNIAKRRSP